MIVVHMFRIGVAAHRADAALLGEKLPESFSPMPYRRRRWYSRVPP